MATWYAAKTINPRGAVRFHKVVDCVSINNAIEAAINAVQSRVNWTLSPERCTTIAANGKNAHRKDKLEFSDNSPGSSGDHDIAAMKKASADRMRNWSSDNRNPFDSGEIARVAVHRCVPKPVVKVGCAAI